MRGVDLALSPPRAAVKPTSLDDFRHLYELHAAEVRQSLRRLAPELDADDLLQEVFVIALDDPDRLAQVESPRAWLFGIAVRLASTRRRTFRIRRFLGLDDAPPIAGSDTPGRSLEHRDAHRAVQRALASLTTSKRETFVLFELQGLTGEEVAQALDIPLKTVWTRLFHARREVTAAVERQLLSEARTSGLSPEELRR